MSRRYDCRINQLALQRRISGRHAEPTTIRPIVHDVLRSPGRPLDPTTRTFMESRFNHDFSRVRSRTTALQKTPAGLAISAVNGRYEQEADRVADKVMRTPTLGSFGMVTSPTRYDFSRVRVHTGPRAAESAQAVNALAYTVGRDLVFGEGHFAPETEEGRKLLAHELTHVVQQTNNIPGREVVQRQNAPRQPARPPTRPLGPIAQARAIAVTALGTAATRIRAAIAARDRGEEVPDDVMTALLRYFPQETPDFLDLMLRRVQITQRILQNVHILSIREVSMAMGAVDPDAPLHSIALELGYKARAFPQNNYIAVYPAWHAQEDLRPTRLVHEIFHYVFPSFIIGHPHNTPRANAFAYQGFVSLLGRIPAGARVENYATEAE